MLSVKGMVFDFLILNLFGPEASGLLLCFVGLVFRRLHFFTPLPQTHCSDQTNNA
jgi:hypothetical protein